MKNYEQDMDTLTKQQKQAVEKAEFHQQQDMKTTGKKIKIEQVKLWVLFFLHKWTAKLCNVVVFRIYSLEVSYLCALIV